MNEAQKIADAVLASVEGEDLLIEAMARAMCMRAHPLRAPDEMMGSSELWKAYIDDAYENLICDRVMRGPGDRAAYERIVAEAKERDL